MHQRTKGWVPRLGSAIRVCIVTPCALGRVSGILGKALELARQVAAHGHSLAIASRLPLPREMPAGVVGWHLAARKPFANSRSPRPILCPCIIVSSSGIPLYSTANGTERRVDTDAAIFGENRRS